MPEVEMIVAPDPIYNTQCSPRMFDWQILVSRSVKDVLTPDFGETKLMSLPNDPFLNLEVEDALVNETTVKNLSLEALKALRDDLVKTPLYQSSLVLKKIYVEATLNEEMLDRPYADNYFIFISSFFDQYLLGPIDAQIKKLDAEQREVGRLQNYA
jgi:hypothetical protein